MAARARQSLPAGPAGAGPAGAGPAADVLSAPGCFCTTCFSFGNASISSRGTLSVSAATSGGVFAIHCITDMSWNFGARNSSR